MASLSRGAAVCYTLLDAAARDGMNDGLDRADLQVGRGYFQPFPPSIRVQQILGLIEDPVVSDGR